MSQSEQLRSSDPTGTGRLRDNYRARLNGGFRTLSGAIREAIAERDIFNLSPDTDVLQDLPTPPNFGVARDEEKQALFMEWLRQAEEEDILQRISRDNNPFIRNAYRKGLRDAEAVLREEGVDVQTGDLEDVFNMPVHETAVQGLFTKNYSDLKDITEEMNKQISEELAEGFTQGENPRKIARRLTGRVDAIGKTRAEALARTNIIEAYSDATVQRYDDFGVTRVTVKAEWLTAGDNRVCPICASLEGEVFTTERLKQGSTFHFDPSNVEDAAPSLEGDYPIKPPAHVNCRCRLIPEVV